MRVKNVQTTPTRTYYNRSLPYFNQNSRMPRRHWKFTQHHRTTRPPTARFVPCLHRFQKGICQVMACSLMGHYAEIQYQNLVCAIEQLYDNAISAVQMNVSTGEPFRTTAGVRKGCLPSPTLFNIFLERIMSDSLE